VVLEDKLKVELQAVYLPHLQLLTNSSNAADCLSREFYSIPEAFTAQAARAPDAVALLYGGQCLTYRELDVRSTQLARKLQRRGVGLESVVGVCAQGIEMIVAMLGILKAGGAYLPLPPCYPRERLEWMVKDARAVMVLWQQSAGDFETGPHRREVWLFRSLWPEIASESEEPLPFVGSPEGLAYVMYTSGSSGHPKGVAIPHAGVLGLVLNTNYITVGPDDRVAQASNMAFDAATFEVWGALLNGARLVGIARETLISPGELERELQQQGVTVLFLTTAVFNQMASERPGAFRSLRAVLFGGEACAPRAVAAVLRHGPPQQLINGYGPTECTTFALCHEVGRVDEGARTIPIGRPISNTEVLLLDANLQEVAEGDPGEIYLGGPRLARGYLHREDLTQMHFVPHPYAHGRRLYRTGDLARALPDGTLEFIGRTDQQVKLRGFRIELGEVEAALGGHPGVAQLAVLALGEMTEDNRLVAYLTASRKGRPSRSELRAFLRKHLPEYMIPSLFVWLDRLPITSNGKLDRRALAAMKISLEQQEGTYAPPQTPTEKALAVIWGELLQQPRVDRDDNFFEIGGHSILAARMFAKIRTRLGKSLPLGILFRGPTLRALAAMVDRAESVSLVVEIQPGGAKLPVFLVHGGNGGVFIFRALATHMGRERTVYGIEAPWLTQRPDRHWSMEELAAFYLQEIRGVQPHGPYHLGGYSLGGCIAFEMAQQLRQQGEEVASLLMLDAFNAHGAVQTGWLEMIAGLGFRRKIKALRSRARRNIKGIMGLLASIPMPGKPLTSRLRRIDFAVAQTVLLLRYQPRVYTGPITLILCEPLGEEFGFKYNLTYGWEHVAFGGLQLMRTPGTHEIMFLEPHVQTLARQIVFSLKEKP
jgi:amino acid adenylation domain-containing protein